MFVSQLLAQALAEERAGRFDAARQSLRSALPLDDEQAGEVRLRLGRLCVLGGHGLLDEANELLLETRAVAEQERKSRLLARALHLLALLERTRGDLDAAKAWLDQSPVLGDIETPGPEAGQLFHYRGLIAQDAGQLPFAERQYFRALQLYRETDYEPGQAEVCDSLSGLLHRTGKLKAAERFAEQSLRIKRAQGDRFGESITLGTLGRIARLQGRYADAGRYFQQDLDIARELQDTRGIGVMLNGLGDLALATKDAARASECFRESLSEDESPKNRLFAHLGLARAALLQNDLDSAEREFSDLDALLAAESFDADHRALVQGHRGELLRRKGDDTAAEQALTAAIAELRRHKYDEPVVPLLYELRDLYQARDDLPAAISTMVQALEILCERARSGVSDVEDWLRTVDQPALVRLGLERHIPEHLVDHVLSGNLSLPAPTKRNVVILFSDVRGFTSLSEALPPEDVVELLNEWFSEATQAIQHNGGIVDKFIGDAVMALFGVPDWTDEAPAAAVRAALQMRDALSAMNLRQQALGKELRVGIGVEMGEAVVGFIGSHLRQSFTAIGDAVNTASRLESATKDIPGCDILVSKTVADAQAKFRVAETSFAGDLELKGRTQRVPSYQVLGLLKREEE